MTRDPLRYGAKSALKMAHECEAAALTGDRKHAEYWLAEAKRHRERAAWYLSRRNPVVYPIEEVCHELAL
jgi:hypothetical protein